MSLITLCFAGPLWAVELSLKDYPHIRRPIAAAWLEENKLLAVANQRSGSISIVDIQKHNVLDEVVVGERLADIGALPSAGWLLAVDEKRHELLVMQWDAGAMRVAERILLSRFPASVAISPDGSRCTVASMWSRTITTFGIAVTEGPPKLTRQKELTLSFAPAAQLYLPDGEHVLVADAFTGQMAVLDVAAQRVVKVYAKSIIRIYGMALSVDRGGLYVGHQAAVRLMRASGAAAKNDKAKQLANFVGEYSIEGLLNGQLERFVADPEAPPTRSGYFEGDLRQMAELAPGRLMVTTEGHHQSLGTAEGQPLVLVRRFWDEIVVSDPYKPSQITTISLGPMNTLTAADRGEALFYDTSLSANGWMSCHSCHPDGHTTGQLADTLGDGTKGTHKRTLTLLGSAETGKWAWSGDVTSLDKQVIRSLQKTMGKRSTPQVANDIVAFLHTLPPPPPLKPASDDPADQEQLRRGEELFRELGCVNCHVPSLGYTSDKTYDIGLRDEKRMHKFNPPSLRGVSQGYSFFHDGRATKLEDVFVVHRHPHGDELSEDDLKDLLRFLSSL